MASKKIAKVMDDLDFFMFTTHAGSGGLRTRPMSNNGEIKFDGHLWFFSYRDTRKISEIEADSRVYLSYADAENARYVSLSGTAEIVRGPEKKRELWFPELKYAFDGGPDSEKIVLIKVTPAVVAYWMGKNEGEFLRDPTGSYRVIPAAVPKKARRKGKVAGKGQAKVGRQGKRTSVGKGTPSSKAKETAPGELTGYLDLESDDDLAREVGFYVLRKLERTAFLDLSHEEQVIACVAGLEMDVDNGGFRQYYTNSPGDQAIAAVSALKELGARHTETQLVKANAVFGRAGPGPTQQLRWAQMDAIGESADARWDELEGEFNENRDFLSVLAARYIRRNWESFTD